MTGFYDAVLIYTCCAIGLSALTVIVFGIIGKVLNRKRWDLVEAEMEMEEWVARNNPSGQEEESSK